MWHRMQRSSSALLLQLADREGPCEACAWGAAHVPEREQICLSGLILSAPSAVCLARAASAHRHPS